MLAFTSVLHCMKSRDRKNQWLEHIENVTNPYTKTAIPLILPSYQQNKVRKENWHKAKEKIRINNIKTLILNKCYFFNPIPCIRLRYHWKYHFCGWEWMNKSADIGNLCISFFFVCWWEHICSIRFAQYANSLPVCSNDFFPRHFKLPPCEILKELKFNYFYFLVFRMNSN